MMQLNKFTILVLVLVLLAGLVRGYHLLSSPPSLYWEEAAIGYDAYSILKTGHDHHGHFLPVIAFESFGDWKPALYFYLVAGAEAFLGLTPLAVRLPALLAGTLTVLGIAIMAWLLLIDQHKLVKLKWLFLLTLLLGAVSPWGIMFSRAGWESTVATCFLVWGVVVWLWAERKNQPIWFFILAVTSIALSAYTYHAARLIAPLLVLGLLTHFLVTTRQQFDFNQSAIYRKLKPTLIVGVIFAIFLLPIISLLKSDAVSNRFNTSSIFADGAIVLESNQLRANAHYSVVSRIIYHRYVLSGYAVMENVIKHFSPVFLLISGDVNWRHSTQFFGQLYWLDAIFVPIGLLWLWRHQKIALGFLSLYLLICLLPSALSTGAPHAVRTLASLPFWIITSAVGFYTVIVSLHKTYIKKATLIFFSCMLVLVMAYLGQFIWFYYDYQVIYPKLSASAWQFGYYQLYQTLSAWQKLNPESQIYVTREQGRPAMYYFFFSQIDPRSVQNLDQTASKDQGEFLAYGAYHFVDSLDNLPVGSLVAASPAKMKTIASQIKILSEIKSLDGSVVWQIGQYE